MLDSVKIIDGDYQFFTEAFTEGANYAQDFL